MSVMVRHFLSGLDGSPGRQPYVSRAIFGLPSPQGAATPAKLCPELSCSKSSCPGEQAVPSSKKEISMELAKSPGSIYIPPLPLTVPLGWAYGDEFAAMMALATNWKHTP